MKLKYLLIVNDKIDESITIFKHDTATAEILKYVDDFLKDEEWLAEFKACERDPKLSLFEHYKYCLSDKFSTHIAIETTELTE